MTRVKTRAAHALSCTALVGAAWFGGARAAQAAANTVGLSPATSHVAVNQTFNLALQGSSFTQTVDGGGVTLGFNPSLLQVQSVTVDATTWEFFTQAGTIDNVGGHVTDIAFASFAGRTGTFPIATVTFRQIAAGASQVTMTESTLNPFGSGGQHLVVSFSPASVTTAAASVPVGPVASVAIAALLLVAGLRALAVRARALSQSTNPSAEERS